MTCVMGIDPGKNGGIAVWLEGRPVNAVPMPASNREIYRFIHEQSVGAVAKIVYIEKLTGFAGEKVPSHTTVKLGMSNGVLLGILTALGFEIHEVAPQTWQKSCNAGTRNKKKPKSEWKNHLKNIAGNLFPNAKLTLSTSDALLILHHGIKDTGVNDYNKKRYNQSIYYDYHYEKAKDTPGCSTNTDKDK